jgi:hypothetical protein
LSVLSGTSIYVPPDGVIEVENSLVIPDFHVCG